MYAAMWIAVVVLRMPPLHEATEIIINAPRHDGLRGNGTDFQSQVCHATAQGGTGTRTRARTGVSVWCASGKGAEKGGDGLNKTGEPAKCHRAGRCSHPLPQATAVRTTS